MTTAYRRDGAETCAPSTAAQPPRASMPTNVNACSPCGKTVPMPCNLKGPLHEIHWSIISDWTKHPSFILSLIINLKRLKKKKKKKNAENQQLTPLPTMAMEHSIRWLYCKLLSHSLVNAHLGCFQTWAIVRKATISKQKGKTAEKQVKAQWKHMTKIIAGTWVKGGG